MLAVVINPKSFKYIGCFKHPKTTNIATQDYKILDGHPSTVTLSNKSTKSKNKDYIIEMCAQAPAEMSADERWQLTLTVNVHAKLNYSEMKM
jgi:hypothetical protein